MVGLAIVNTIIGGCGGGLTVLFANKFLVTGNHAQNNLQLCSVLEKSPFGAKSGFEIWAFKGFLYLDKKISPKKGLEVSTPKNVKWKKYIRQSENANGRPLEPLWGSK